MYNNKTPPPQLTTTGSKYNQLHVKATEAYISTTIVVQVTTTLMSSHIRTKTKAGYFLLLRGKLRKFNL